MVNIITPQELANLDRDILDTGKAVNTKAIITPRFGPAFKSLPLAIQEVIETGGFEPFATEAALLASVPTLTKKAAKALDTKKIWLWDSGAWVDTGLSELSRSENYVNSKVLGVKASSLAKPKYTLKEGGFNNDGFLIAGMTGYKHSTAFQLLSGQMIQFKSNGSDYACLIETDVSFSMGRVLLNVFGNETGFNYTYVAEKDMHVSVCGAVTSDTFEISLSVAPSIGLKRSYITKNEFDSFKTEVQVSSSAKLAEELVLEKSTGNGFSPIHAPIAIQDTQAKAVEIFLCEGDVLTFDAYNYKGITLQTWVRSIFQKSIGYPIIMNEIESTEIKSHSYTSNKNQYVRLSGYVAESIKVNGAQPSKTTNLGNWRVEIPASVDSIGEYAEMMITEWFSVKKGDVIRIDKVLSGTVPIAVQYPNTAPYAKLGSPRFDYQDSETYTLEWEADRDCTIAVSAHKNAKIYKVKIASSSSVNTHISFDYLPDRLSLSERTRVFATAMNYILKLENVGGVEKIATSEDLGKTWKYSDNIIGDITAYHFFSDGTIMLCSPTKVFWSINYTQWNESTVYDHDGSTFVPTRQHFFAMQTGDKIDFVGDTEIHSWGDYVDIGEARIWYTIDNGRTVKCSIKFGTTPIGGIVRNVRHTHRVYYHAKTNYWYLTTGDEGNECMIIRGRYDPDTDIWDWKILASGIEYKFGNMMIDDNNMAYMITDYTDPSLIDKKGVYRVHASNLGDISKYRIIYKCDPLEWGQIAPVSLLMDNNGNKVLLPDYLGGGYIWVARDGLNFKRVVIPNGILMAYTIGENYNGDVYCVAYEGGSNLRLSSGSYNLTEMLRKAGVTDFMRGAEIISGLTTCVS